MPFGQKQQPGQSTQETNHQEIFFCWRLLDLNLLPSLLPVSILQKRSILAPILRFFLQRFLCVFFSSFFGWVWFFLRKGFGVEGYHIHHIAFCGNQIMTQTCRNHRCRNLARRQKEKNRTTSAMSLLHKSMTLRDNGRGASCWANAPPTFKPLSSPPATSVVSEVDGCSFFSLSHPDNHFFFSLGVFSWNFVEFEARRCSNVHVWSSRCRVTPLEPERKRKRIFWQEGGSG